MFGKNKIFPAVPVNDPESLQNKIELLADDKALRDKMGKAARQKTVEEYSWDAIARELEKAFVSGE